MVLELDEYVIPGFINNRARIIRQKVIDCLKVHFSLSSDCHLPSTFYTDHQKPNWYRFMRWKSINNLRKEDLADPKEPIAEAFIKTIEAFYEANGQSSKLSYGQEKRKKSGPKTAEQDPTPSTSSYTPSIENHQLDNLKEIDISTGDKDKLRHDLIYCIKIHFNRSLKMDLPSNFYQTTNPPEWYKFIKWGSVRKAQIKDIKIQNMTMTNALTSTIAEFYKTNGQSYKLIRSDTIELPDPATLFFFGEKRRDSPLIKVIQILKNLTKIEQNARSVCGLEYKWSKNIDITDSYKVNALTVEDKYKVIIAGYNHFGHQLAEDYFAPALNGNLKSVISSIRPLEFSYDNCKEKHRSVRYIHHNNRFYNCKLCEECESIYGLSLLNSNERDDLILREEMEKSIQQLEIKSQLFLKKKDFNMNIKSKVYVFTPISRNLSNSKYTGFYISPTRIPTHIVLIETIRRNKLKIDKINRFYKYYHFAQLIDQGEQIFISILFKSKESGYSFPLILQAETMTFRTNLRDPEYNIQDNSNIIPDDYQLKDEIHYYHLLKKVQFEFEKCEKSIILNKEKLEKIDLSLIIKSGTNDLNKIEESSFAYGEEILEGILDFK